MGKVPGFLLVHTIVVEPLLGNYSQGPSYGDFTPYRCYIDEQTTMQRDRDGNEVVSSSTVIAELGADIPLDSRVTLLFMKLVKYLSLSNIERNALLEAAKTTIVLETKKRDSGGLPAPDHLEIVLK